MNDEPPTSETPTRQPDAAGVLRDCAERIRRVKTGERHRVVYGFEDEKMDEFMYRMLENAHTSDLEVLADAYFGQQAEIDRLQTTLKQTIADECETDTAIRNLCEPTVGTLAAHGDGYMPPLVDVVGAVVKETVRLRGIEERVKECPAGEVEAVLAEWDENVGPEIIKTHLVIIGALRKENASLKSELEILRGTK